MGRSKNLIAFFMWSMVCVVVPHGRLGYGMRIFGFRLGEVFLVGLNVGFTESS
jgi:hypothetical protein